MKQKENFHGDLANLLAPTMFLLSLLFLVFVAALIVVWVDIPRFDVVGEPGASDDVGLVTPLAPDQIVSTAERLGGFLSRAIWVLWAVIAIEVIVQSVVGYQFSRDDRSRSWYGFALLQVLCPPLRLAAPNAAEGGKVWLPWLGWRMPSRQLFKQLEAVFSKPMLFFAILILPVLLIEFGLHDYVVRYKWLRLTMHVCTGLIWCAFAVEFIVLVNASHRRFAYVKKNWLDLAIILLPIIMFLRSLRALRLARIAQFAKVQQLANMSRIYRLRGMAMKAIRALLLLEVFHRLLRISPESRLNRLQAEYDEKMLELDEIQEEIDKVKVQIQENEQS